MLSRLVGWHRDARSEDGAVSIIMAASMLVLAGFSAVVIDAGLLHLTRRNLQAATDVAALAAARRPADAATLAAAQLTANGFAAGTVRTTAVGRWDPTRAAAARFTASPATSADAVQVASQTTVPMFFGRLLTGTASAQVNARATASSVPLGSFAIGSGTAGLNAGLANQILGTLLGASLSLDAVAYQGLTNASVDALRFLDALAIQAGLSVGTYAELANTTISANKVLRAAASVLGDPKASTGASGALATVTALVGSVSSGPLLRIGDLVDLGFWREQTVGSSAGASTLHGVASLNVFDLITTAGQIGGAGSLISLPTALNIPGIVKGTIRLGLVEPMQSAPATTTDARLAVGPVGIKAATAQVRLAVDLELLDLHYLKAVPLLGPLLTALLKIELPLYIDVAPAQGELTAVTCGGNPATDSTITVRATSGIARIAVGTVSSNALSATGPISLPAGSTLVNLLGIVKIVANASAQAGQGGPTSLVFNATQIAAHTSQSISSGKTVSTLLTSLLSSLRATNPPGLQVTILSVLPINVGLVVAAVGDTIAPVLTALDPILDQTLRVLGVRVGYAEIQPRGVRCGIPALVN